MRNVGRLIKLERIKKNMKQVSLAKGICSTSYLSKIENNSSTASEEVINLLLNKLNITIPNPDITSKEDREFVIELNKIYKEVTINRNDVYVEEKLLYLQGRNSEPFGASTFFSLNLLILRLTLADNDLEASKIYRDFLDNQTNNFSNLQLYLYQKNLGIYYYKIKDNENSLKSFISSLDLIDEISIQEWDKADLYYMMSLVYISDGQTLNSIDFARKSLNIFKNYFLYNRAIDSYIVLGIAYKRSSRFKDSLDTFRLALKIESEFNMENYKGKLYQNIGSLYSQKNSKKAIEYYIKSLSYKNNANEKLITIFSIIIEYTKLNNKLDVDKWLAVGFGIIENNSDTDEAYLFHFLVYKNLNTYGYLQEKDTISAIEYFERMKDYRHCYKYSILLGNSFYQNGSYKSAATIFNKAHYYLLKLNKIKHWEDM